MKDKWSDDIREKMSNYEIAPPKDLWYGVISNLPHRRAHNHILWPLAGAFALASIVLIVLIGQNKSVEPTHFADAKDFTARVIIKDEKKLQQELVAPSRLNGPQKRVSTSEIGKENSLSAVENTRLDDDSKGKPVKDEETQEIDDAKEVRREVDYHEKPKKQRIIDSRYAFKVYSSVAGGYSRNSISRSGFSKGLGMENANWMDDPALGVAVFNYGTAQKTEMKHDIPMKIGLVFSYEFTDRISLSAGISNVFLRSEYREGTQHHYRSGEQNIRYIGVPLDIKYDFFTFNSLNLYCSWGVSFDKCYKATRTNDYIIGDENRLKEVDNLNELPFQFSTSLNLGLEYCLYNGVWAFAQGGLGYYFNDGSSLNTIYKFRPANFSLGAGLRIDMSFTR